LATVGFTNTYQKSRAICDWRQLNSPTRIKNCAPFVIGGSWIHQHGFTGKHKKYHSALLVIGDS